MQAPLNIRWALPSLPFDLSASTTPPFFVDSVRLLPRGTHHGHHEALEVEALIGIYDWERNIRQPLWFDIEMAFDNRVPAATDAITDTLDYKAVSKRVIQLVSASDFGLVETLAEQVAAAILDEFGVAHVRLKLSKPGAVRGARAVGVIIERSAATLGG